MKTSKGIACSEAGVHIIHIHIQCLEEKNYFSKVISLEFLLNKVTN